MKKWIKFLSVGALFVLSACESILDAPTDVATPMTQISQQDPQWQAHVAQLKQIDTYAAKGLFGYISPEERFSSRYDWQYHTPTQFSLDLSHNLSSKSLKLQRTSRGLTVSDSKGNSRTETDINLLMEEMIGVAFPIDQFAFWLKGLPEGNQQYIINEKRQLTQFQYPLNGVVWQVNYVEYHEDRQPNLPKLIVLENGQQTLKIRIDQWIL